MHVLAEQPDADSCVVQFIESLPSEVRQLFFESLEDAHREDFHGKWFFIGLGPRDITPQERANLRRIWEILKSGES